jgi:hypothetical protein
MNEWKVTFLVREKDNIAVNVKSNNEMYARQNAIRKLLTQYGYLNLKEGEYRIVQAKLIKKEPTYFKTRNY